MLSQIKSSQIKNGKCAYSEYNFQKQESHFASDCFVFFLYLPRYVDVFQSQYQTWVAKCQNLSRNLDLRPQNNKTALAKTNCQFRRS